METRTKMSEW